MLTKKRSISLLLAVAMLLCCLQGLLVSAGAENIRRCGDDLTWTLGGGTLTISGTGDMYNYTSSSHAPWFDDRDEIKRIEIGPEVTSIGDYAFRNCAITSLTIPGNVKSIGQYAFRTNQSLKELILEDGVESLGTHAFAYCSSLGTIRLTSSVKRIAERAIFDCPVLTDVYYVGTQEQWDAMTIEAGNHKFTGVIRNMATAFGTCGDTLNWDLINGILTISGEGAMYDYDEPHAPWFDNRSKVTKIKIGSGVTHIGDRAFRNCAITEVTIPGNVKTVGQYAFRTCDSLKEVTLEEGVQTIEANAFTWCDTLETVNLPVSVTSIEEKAFFDCTMLKDVYYPGSQQQWEQMLIGSGNESFINANHILTGGRCGKTLYWSLSGTTLTIDGEGRMYDYTDGKAPWYGSRETIESIVLQDRIVTIGDYAFQGCAVTGMTIPATVQTVGQHAFDGCVALTELTVANGVKEIGKGAFAGCAGLTTVRISKSITAIEENAFDRCAALTDVYYGEEQTYWDMIRIGSGNECLTGANLQLPLSGVCGDNLRWVLYDKVLTISGTGDMYDYSKESPAPWKSEKKNAVYVEEGVTSIGDYAFYATTGADVYLADTVKDIGHEAFAFGTTHVHLYFYGEPAPMEAGVCKGSYAHIYMIEGLDSLDKTIKYGGNNSFYDGQIRIREGKMLYGMNEEIRPEDFTFEVLYYGDYASRYVPRNVVIGAYDNSAYGQATVKLSVDGIEIEHTYFVTDGQTHWDMIDAEYSMYRQFEMYNSYSDKDPAPVVTAGKLTLEAGKDFKHSYSYDNRQMILGQKETLTVTGIGVYAGFQETYPVAIVKRNVADNPDLAWTSLESKVFNGGPLQPKGTLYSSGYILDQGVYYELQARNAVNIGTATVRMVGIGDWFYGYIEEDCNISASNSTVFELKGAYNGEADGTLNQEVYEDQRIISPAKATFRPSTQSRCVAVYELYHIQGEDAVLISSKQSEYGYSSNDPFIYDFSSVYEDAYGKGGEVYVLAYSWVESDMDVYSGMLTIGVPAKVEPATQMEIEYVYNDKDFRMEYFNVVGVDGALENVVWTSSNSAVATVENGIVTLKKPGTAKITITAGALSETIPVTVDALNIGDAELFGYTSDSQTAIVIYENILLIQGKDYTITTTQRDGIVDVTVIGCGLFEGAILRQFETRHDKSVGHTHVLSAACDPFCETCDFVKESVHTLNPGWKRDAEGHWHVCKLCGEKEDYAEHTYTDAETCAVCGSLNLPGDMNNDYEVTDADAVYLLRYTLFPDSYPITRNGDFNNDGSVTDADAVYLLRYTLFPESYPIQ